MPALYMGRGGLDGLFGGGGSVGPITRPVTQPAGPGRGPGSVGPITNPVVATGASPNVPAPAPPEGSVLGAQTIRATGDAKGYDPSYLQNLATSIGGLFARPQGNMNFNPLGNLSEISPPGGQTGNAPSPGAPETWLQQALNGLSFLFKPQASPVNPVGSVNGGDGVNTNRGRGRGRMMLDLP
jgi:hypothetical protein